MRGEQAFLAFNRGMISRLAMARTDLKRYGLSAQVQTNWVSRVLGSTMLRPGFGYLGGILNHTRERLLPFVFSTRDTALLELTDQAMRVWVNDALVSRVAVSTAVSNGTFTSNLTGWTDADESGAVSVWVTGGYLGLTGSSGNAAIRTQAIAIAAPDQNVEHAMRIVVTKGPVEFSLTDTSTTIRTTLETGVHSIAFTPTGASVTISLGAREQYQALVDSIEVEGPGVLELPAPWLEADLPMVRQDQSGDVVFVACDGYQQRRIERRSTTSWSIVLYESLSGPFRAMNITSTTITPSGLSGSVTLTASAALFRSTQVGGLFSLTSTGQLVSRSITAQNTFTDEVEVNGVGNDRGLSISISGLTATGSTVTLQRSIGAPGTWVDVDGQSFTADVATTYYDALDNQIIFYRIGVKTGFYSSGTIACALQNSFGSITGIARITGYTSPTQVTADVLSAFGGVIATDAWAESVWSDFRGWPSAVAFYEGRLWWAGKDRFLGSITDEFANFDQEREGDSAPIIRSIGSGPVDVINWLLPMQRLMAGTDGSVVAGRSSSFDEPLTATNFNPKPTITQGCAAVPAVKVDGAGMFVQRGGARILSMAYSINDNDYMAEDLSALVPGIGKPGVVSFGAQRQPDTRLHAVRSDGVVAVMIYDKLEDVNCWILIETDGVIEDYCVLPDDDEDAVYYVVRRVIGGVDKRFLERWAREDEAVGGTVNKQADSFITYSQSASATISGLDHLIGKDVVVWDNGVCLADANGNIATFTVAGDGTITVTHEGEPRLATVGMAGLQYEARYQSTKLAYLVQPGDSGLTTRKRIHSMGVVLADTHAQGLEYGPDFNTMDSLPLMESFELVDPDGVWDEYNYEAFAFPGEWKVDSRMCLRATAPRPCTILAAVAGMNANPTS